MSDDSLLYFNGINGSTGEYGLTPRTADELSLQIQGKYVEEAEDEDAAAHASELASRADSGGSDFRPVGSPDDMGANGWGIIFPHKVDPAIREALDDLIKHRQQQVDNEEHFHVFDEKNAYRPASGRKRAETKVAFATRQGVGFGPVQPEKIPYYLLVVGGPETIPYDFQYQLGVQYAVGRLHFDTPEEYANYARNVIAAETGQVKLSRDLTFFGVANEDDKATQLSSQYLVDPVRENMLKYINENTADGDNVGTWNVQQFVKDQATKSQLSSLLGGDQTPALLFTASHGMEFAMDDANQVPHQGALLCQDWPGPLNYKGAIPQDFYFAGDDLTSDTNLLGLMAFFFACYGGGTPLNDEFARQSNKDRAQIAKQPFVSRLPQKMLGQGALAVLAHMERAWGYSFLAPKAGQQTAVFERTLEPLLRGLPVGFAMEELCGRYAELASQMSYDLGELEYDENHISARELVGNWTAHNDARGYILLGDPAARLPVATEDETPEKRPAFTELSIPKMEGGIATKSASATTADSPTADKSFAVDDAAQLDHDDMEASGIFGKSKDDSEPNQIVQGMQKFANRLNEFLTDAVQDAATLEISTYTSQGLEDVEYKNGKYTGSATLKAMTHIKIDGDSSVVIPVNDEGEVDMDVWEIHKEMVEQAQRGRAELIQTAVSALTSLATFWKP
ncbi:MAG: hypothetical protein AAF485_21670 [Chloroflexota bacterium]